MNYNANFKAERLIATVARAFYTDNIIVVIDALIREKFIKEEELGPRLRMSQKVARETIARLMDIEMLIKCEEMPSEEGGRQLSKYYYIDYQSFINITRLRIYYIFKSLENNEKSNIDDIYFECPTCLIKYSSLDAMKARSADSKFICPSCCPDFDLSNVISQPYFRLREVDNKVVISTSQLLEKKVKEQLTGNEYHDGILDMLSELVDVPLSHNKPSDHMKRGVRTSQVNSYDINSEINQNVNSKKNNSKTTVNIQEKHFNLLSTRLDGTQKEIITNNTVIKSNKVTNNNSNQMEEDLEANKRMKVSELPDFLNYSGVKGASNIINEINILQQIRGSSSTNVVNIPSNNDILNQDKSTVFMITQSIKSNVIDDTIKEDAEEDIQWEEDDEDNN